MLHVRDVYLCGRRMNVGNGCRTSFLGDAWCGHTPLKEKFPEIYDICMNEISLWLLLLRWGGD
jgi:hypothetical protein